MRSSMPTAADRHAARRMGVDCNAVLSELDTAIDQLPKVSGGSGEVYASPETSKIFNFAEREAKSGGDAMSPSST